MTTFMTRPTPCATLLGTLSLLLLCQVSAPGPVAAQEELRVLRSLVPAALVEEAPATAETTPANGHAA